MTPYFKLYSKPIPGYRFDIVKGHKLNLMNVQLISYKRIIIKYCGLEQTPRSLISESSLKKTNLISD